MSDYPLQITSKTTYALRPNRDCKYYVDVVQVDKVEGSRIHFAYRHGESWIPATATVEDFKGRCAAKIRGGIFEGEEAGDANA